MVLTVTISNRILSFAIFEKGKDPRDAIPVATVSLAAQAPRTADEYAALLGATFSQKAPEAKPRVAIVASVVPMLTGEICRALQQLYPDLICLTVGPGLRSGLTIRTDVPGDLGADLVAMAAGALALQKPPFLVLNLGAVTTLSAVCEGKEAPVFLGCSILPGVALSTDVLKKSTAQLVTVSLTQPQRAVGTNTGDSIRSGVVLGHVAAVEGLIARFEKEIGKGTLPVIATGEEAELLLPLLSRGAQYDGLLSHRGLYRLATLNDGKVAKKSTRV